MNAGDYIKRRVDALRDHSEEVYEQAEGISNEFNSWSALKLILHSAAVNMYTTVHQNQGTGDIFYIDALAGSGVSTYESDRFFIGSPLLACRAAQYPFSKMYFIESDEEYCAALRDRLEYAFKLPDYTKPHDFEVIQGDANEELPSVVADLKEIGDYDDRFNYYCFIDNQGLDVEWSSISELTPTPYGDLLINLPIAQGIGRNVDTDAAAKFYGDPRKKLARGRTNREQLLDRYQEKLYDRDREVQASTRVYSNIGSFYYDLIYATRKIDDGNGYMEVIDYVKQFIESVHSGDVDRMIDVLDTNQSVIESYLPDKSIEGGFPGSEEDEDQSDLDKFI